MLHVNDDSNDELFRRAADNYPLKTDNADWEAVLNKMKDAAAPEGQNIVAAKKSKKNYRYLLLLLLFIPFAIYESKKNTKTNSTDKNNEAITNAAAEKQNTAIVADNNTATAATTGDLSTTTSFNGPVKLANNQTGTQQSNITNQGTITPVNTNDITITGNRKLNKHTQTTGDINAGTTGTGKLSSRQKTRMAIKNALATEDGEDVAGKQKNIPENNTVENGLKGIVPSLDIQKKDEAVATTQKDDTEKTTVKPQDKDVTKPNDKNADKNKKTPEKHFYIGVIAGPDLSAVKMQSVKNVGVSFGLVAGYKLSKRLTIETGLLKDKKYYSTNGEYFSRKNINIPGTVKIEYADGSCNMLELPINLHYNFSKKAHSAWFGSAGVSSYFMKNESYTYELNNNGAQYPRSFNYNTKSTNFAAVVNLSAGYTHKLGKIGELRIEPYLKLPVSKIGTGNLPIQSGGIYIGFTKSIF